MNTNVITKSLAESSRDQESIFAAKVRIFGLIKRGCLGGDVLKELLPGGSPLLFEKAMWDYKECLPTILASPPTDAAKAHAAKMAEIVKDVVSFYNSHGGYLVAGVADNPRRLVGFSGQFDCGDLAKKIRSATNHDIDCHYAVLPVTRNGQSFDIGILQIPQRPHTVANPIQFLKDAPASSTGKQAYKSKDIYFRDGDQSRPAVTSDDYSFLCVPSRRDVVTNIVPPSPVLRSNLGPRDPSLVRFVGREDYLQELWKWLCDPYSPVKLLSGLGGLGKTTIAREFAQVVTVNSPLKLELVIWLSAKRQFFTAIADKFEPITKVDFFDLTTLLRSLLCQLGLPEDQIDTEASRESLIEEVIQALSLYPALVIVDDVDSLEMDQQLDVFQTMIQIMSRTMSQQHVPSRALLTARLQLGASPSQLIKVDGLPLPEFSEYVAITARSLQIPANFSKAQLTKFHSASSGSPAFAASILRLMQTGDTFHTAIERWNGHEGEQVRRFAFSRELDKLTSSQVRTLYAMCILGVTSQLELIQILDCTETRLRDDLGELRKYHLYAFTGAVRAGGAHLEVPGTIRLMQEVIRERIADPKRIEKECAAARSQSTQLGIDAGPMINRVIALWRDDKHDEALSVAKFAADKSPKNPDLQCLLGRAHLKTNPPDPAQAGLAFRNAHKLGCERPELFSLWIESRTHREDWLGVIEITRFADESSPSAENAIIRAQAFVSLAQAAEKSGLLDKAAKKYLEGGRDADSALKSQHFRSRFSDLNALRADLMFNYVRVADRLYAKSDDHIYVWLAFLEAFQCFVRRPLLVRTGVSRLSTWWEAVGRRGTSDAKAAELMKVQLGKFTDVIRAIQEQESPDSALLFEVQSSYSMLESSLNDYSRQITT
jgi:hypothetical protein